MAARLGRVAADGALLKSSTRLVKESAYRFRADGTAVVPATHAELRGSALEQSNVSVVDRIAELTTVSRSFEGLQKALSVMANDVDSRAIAELGRRR